MQPLSKRIDNRMARDSAVESSVQQDAQETQITDEMRAQLQGNLDMLPDEAKRAVAAHLTPEFAKLVGAITGSKPLADMLGEMADPNLALVPVPRNIAQDIVNQVKGQGAAPEQGVSTGQPQLTPEGDVPPPAPEGAMGV